MRLVLNKFSNTAFSIVEVLVAVSLLSIMSYGIAALIQSAFISSHAFEVKQNQNELHGDIYQLLATTSNCSTTFAGLQITPAGLDADIVTGGGPLQYLKRAGPTNIYELYSIGQALYKNRSIGIKDMQLQNMIAIQDPGGNIADGVDMQFAYTTHRLGPNNTLLDYKTRTLGLRAKVSPPMTSAPPYTILSCVAFGGLGDQIWNREANMKIWYSAQNIGIGTSNPVFPLEISGSYPGSVPLSITNTSNTGWSALNMMTDATHQMGIGIGNSGVGLPTANVAYVGPGMGTALPLVLLTGGAERMRIDTNGKVGIGTQNPGTTLDVNGGIRPGNVATVTPCSPATEGQLSYNFATHAIQYCGGSPLSWVTMGSSGCRFCRDHCGGQWPTYGGMADTKDADWSGSEVLGDYCGGVMTYYPANVAVRARLCCAN